MGYVKAKVRIINMAEPARGEELELLADSGAVSSVIPEDVLTRLGIKPEGKRKFKVADGRVIEREYGVMRIELGDKVGATTVVFGKKGDAAVMGVTALEELELKINPVTGELEPLELLLLSGMEGRPAHG